ncbi:hypothetical protein C8P63_10548 [Melghirimyces profundicolus]|uniref:Uncharacterized protein n=1 Tax=Melghirimyces profundicolus TaxID=1242148 RepID=A0A2T6C2D4_9BACL|nr:hypothetical protein [Melghirimyces profundicolus]PTX62453.1 hypothetical protein C8P63_10548 [Melghirimyces profundicolus]
MTSRQERGIRGEHFVRHGGVPFTPKVSPEKITRFVNELPPERRESFYEIMKELSEAGLITVHNNGVLVDGEGKIGGSDDC